MTINAVVELEALGYVFSLDKNDMIFKFVGDHADSEKVRPLLNRIRANKGKAIAFLKARYLGRQPAMPLDELHEFLEDHCMMLTGKNEIKDGVIILEVSEA